MVAPAGVEARLATLTLDLDDLAKFSEVGRAGEAPPSLREGNMEETVKGLPVLFNSLNVRRAVIPAANGHCSARALARYYAALAAGGTVPPPHSASSAPLLGSHPHLPAFPSSEKKPRKKRVNGSSKGKDPAEQNGASSNGHHRSAAVNGGDVQEEGGGKIFCNPKIQDACRAVGDYSHLALPGGKFGLGFGRFEAAGSERAAASAFGHSGMGGATGFCDIAHDFAIAVTVNKMSLGGVTRSIVQLVCSELGVPVPLEFAAPGEQGTDMQINPPPATD